MVDWIPDNLFWQKTEAFIYITVKYSLPVTYDKEGTTITVIESYQPVVRIRRFSDVERGMLRSFLGFGITTWWTFLFLHHLNCMANSAIENTKQNNQNAYNRQKVTVSDALQNSVFRLQEFESLIGTTQQRRPSSSSISKPQNLPSSSFNAQSPYYFHDKKAGVVVPVAPRLSSPKLTSINGYATSVSPLASASSLVSMYKLLIWLPCHITSIPCLSLNDVLIYVRIQGLSKHTAQATAGHMKFLHQD